MSTKGREIGMKEKRGRSPSVPRIGQRIRSPNPPSTLERKKVSSLESRRVPTRPSATSTLDSSLAHNSKNQSSFQKTKPPLRRPLDKHVPPFKVTSTRSKPIWKNVMKPSMKTTGLTKHKDIAESHPPWLKYSTNAKENMNPNGKKRFKQPTKGLGSNVKAAEKKPNTFDVPSSTKVDYKIVTHDEDIKTILVVSDTGPPLSSKVDHNSVTHEEDDKIIPAVDDILMLDDYSGQRLDNEDDDLLHGVAGIEDVGDLPLCDPSNPIDSGGDQEICELKMIDGSVNEHTNDHDKDQVREHTSDLASPDSKVDGEQEIDQESYLGSNVVKQVEAKGQEHEDTTPKEPRHEETEPETIPEEGETEAEMKLGGAEVPKEEEHTSKMVVKSQHEVVDRGKKGTIAYNDVIEETMSKLREQRKNKVRALVGAFEAVISLESDAPRA